MTAAEHRTVVFDVGNVLLHWDPALVYRGVLTPAETQAFFDEIGFKQWNLALDAGRSWADAVADACARHPDRADLIARFDRDWQKSIPSAIDATVQLALNLKAAGVPLYAITNFSAEKWAESVIRFPFLETAFREVVVSAHEGLVKPDPAIFQRLLARHSLDAEDCIFIDDSPANVAAAEGLGFDAIQFTTPPALAVRLRQRGLPI